MDELDFKMAFNEPKSNEKLVAKNREKGEEALKEKKGRHLQTFENWQEFESMTPEQRVERMTNLINTQSRRRF